MKKSFVLLDFARLTLLIMIAMTIMVECHKKDPSPQEVAQGLMISGTWVLDNLSIDNVDKTSLYPGFTLVFTVGKYATTNGKLPVWPSDGTWAFANSSGKSITRDGNLPITIVALDQHKLVLSVAWNSTTFGGGRVGSVGGDNVFTFKK